MAGLRAVENRERPVCPASGQAGTRAWRARLFAASRQDLHAAATPPDAGRNDGRGLAGRQRPASRPQLQDRAARRGHPDLGSRLAAAGRHGRPVLRGLRRRRAGPGRSSLLRRRAPTRSIPKRRRGFGRCPPGSPGSMRSPRAEPPAHAARTGKKKPLAGFPLRETALTSPPTHPAWPASWTGSLGPSRPAPLPAASGRPR